MIGESMKAWLSEHRRHLHQNPELSLKEEQTSLYCQNVLKTLGYSIKPCWGYGFTAELKADKSKKTIAIRADMDALPIQEKNTHGFCSKHQGVAHMCGHDAHMTIALGAARLISLQKERFNDVRFIFQPCEETPPGGAKGMIEQGALDGVDEIYGLHNDPGTPVGTIKTRIGPLMAYADRFELTVKGIGCHAARPHDGLDPIAASCQLVNSWQHLISRFINPVNPAVLTVGAINGGDTFNVIPGFVTLKGTMRTFNEKDRQTLHGLLLSSLETTKAQGFGCDFDFVKGYDAVINHEIGVDKITKAAKNVLNPSDIITECQPQGWGEDFAYYLQHVPGAFFFLGSGNEKITAPLHSPYFDIDEDCLLIGAKIFSHIAAMSD
jgi:amidohydrolase